MRKTFVTVSFQDSDGRYVVFTKWTTDGAAGDMQRQVGMAFRGAPHVPPPQDTFGAGELQLAFPSLIEEED